MLWPQWQKTISCKWVFKVKYYLDASTKRYKASLIAHGFSHVDEIDYIKTFTPLVWRKSLRIFLTITVILEIILIQTDILEVYLQSAFG